MSEAPGTSVFVDGNEVRVIDETDLNLDSGTVMEALAGQAPEVAALVRWTANTQGLGGNRARSGGLLQRDRYVTPSALFDQFRTAKDACESDDVVSGVLETTEALAFTRMSFLAEDEDEEDVWNQIAADLDLDARLREMWRELFCFSQFYCLVWYGNKNYKVRGKTLKGNEKRKTFDQIRVPIGMSLLDPLKVVPVGTLLFNQERLAYLADRSEEDMLEAAAKQDPQADPLAREIVVGEYKPNQLEKRQLENDGIEVNKLFLLNPVNVWRHTVTRPQYERFATCRMKSVFELLDQKQQLRQMDRAHLIGSTNFIVLIRKGTDERPAKPQEIAALQSQVRTIAQVPVMVGDHRLSIDIITPKTDNTLMPEKYNGIDARITARLYQMFMTGSSGAGSGTRGDDSIKLAKVVGRGMESRRHMLRRSLERHLILPTFKANEAFTESPKLRFHPARVELSFDAAMVQFLIDVRDRGDMSRETYLNEVDIDQGDEALLRKREKERFDKVFEPTNVPFSVSKPNNNDGGDDNDNGPPNDPRTAGRNQGGNRNGGGSAPGSGQGQPPRRGRPKEND